MRDFHNPEYSDEALFGGSVNPYSDTGLFGIGKAFKKIGKAVGKAAKGVGKGVSSAAKVAGSVVSAPVNLAKHIPVVGGAISAAANVIASPVNMAVAVASGQRIDKAVMGQLKSQLADIKTLAPYAQTVVSVVPGVGPGISGGIAAGLALASGKTINQAMVDAVKASIPGGPLAQAAFAAVEAAASGKALDKIAIAALPISPQAKQAIQTSIVAVRALAAGQRVDTTIVDAALQAVPETYRKATQVAIAVAQGKRIQASQVLGAAAGAATPAFQRATAPVLKQVRTMARPLTNVINVLPPPNRRKPLSLLTNSQQTIQRTLQRAPQLRALPTASLARRLGMHPSQVSQVLKRGGFPSLPFQGISGNAARFVRTHSRFAPRNALVSDVRGLIDNGKTYVVESGDFPGKIAQKLTGNSGNWPQLIKANPKKATVNKGIGPEFKTLYAGEKLILPASWVKSVPTVPPALADSATVIQAKAILAAWGNTDGKASAGVVTYGANPDDLSSGWGARDSLMLTSFSKWSNVGQGTKLSTDGDLTPAHSAALRAWAEKRATSTTPTIPTSTPVPTPSVTVPSLPGIPAVVISTPQPVTPSPGPSTPILPTTPVVTSPGWPAITPAAPSAPSQAQPAAQASSGGIAPILAGVGLGYTLFGVPGALLGGLGGAVLSPKKEV